MRKIIFLLIIIILSSSVAGIGIAGFKDPEPILFQPNLTFTREYTMSKYRFDAEPYVDGDLREHVTLHDLKDYGDYKTFSATISLPESLGRGGIHTILIGVGEKAPENISGIFALTRAQRLIEILVLYEEKKANFLALTTPNVNENETTTFSFKAESISIQKITDIGGTIKIYDYDMNLVKTLTIENFELESAEKKDIEVEFNPEGLKPGQYFAEAEILWENESVILENKFNIGTLNLEVLDFTRNFTAGQINKITITIESKWKGRINGLFAKLFVDKDEQTTTQNYDLSAFEKKYIVGYLDLTYIDSGDHDLRIELFYEGEKKVVEDTIKLVGEGKRKPLNINITTTELMMFLVIIVLILVMILLIYEHRRKK